MKLEGRILGHVDGWAIVQCPVGLIPICDSSAALVAGDGALLDVRPLGDEYNDTDDVPCTAFEVRQGQALALLRRPADPCAPPIPVVLNTSWPEIVVIRAYSPSPEIAEGSENFRPPAPPVIT